MTGWGVFLLGGGLIALSFYVHKRRLTWVALILGLFDFLWSNVTEFIYG